MATESRYTSTCIRPHANVYICEDCGSLVEFTAQQIHDKWHARIDGIGATAREADRWAGMMRPLA
jgi:Fe2+ or Zn2+ uptake regulation protein